MFHPCNILTFYQNIHKTHKQIYTQIYTNINKHIIFCYLIQTQRESVFISGVYVRQSASLSRSKRGK